MLVPLLKAKQSVSLVIEESFNQLRDATGSMLGTNGCYDINHLIPYLEKGHIGQKLSLMTILDWLYPDNAIHAFPKYGTNCSNNELVAPSPTQAPVPRNIINTGPKADLFGGKKVSNSKLSESKNIRKYGKADLYREEKVSNSKLSESVKIRKYGNVGKPQPSGINKSKSTFGFPSKRKQNSKSNEANNRLPEIYKSLTSFDSNEYPKHFTLSVQIVIKKAKG